MVAGRRRCRCRCRVYRCRARRICASDFETRKWGSNVTRVRNDARGPYQRPPPRLVTRNSTFHLPPDSAAHGETFRAPCRDQVYPGNCFDAPFRRRRCSRQGTVASSRIGMLQHPSWSRVLRLCRPPIPWNSIYLNLSADGLYNWSSYNSGSPISFASYLLVFVH